MAIVDFGYQAGQASDATDARSVEVKPCRNGYCIRPTVAAAGRKARLPRLIIALFTAIVGIFLALKGGALVSPLSNGASLIVPIGIYLVMVGGFWCAKLVRHPPELIVDKGSRAFHLIQPGFSGTERSRQTIRFEEVARIELIDNVRTYDMTAQSKNWSIARLDVIWQRDRTSAMITGDIAEIEPLLGQLRREVGMA